MKEHMILQVVSMNDAAKVAAMDSHAVSTSGNYVKDNTLTYYIACNTWLLIWKDFCPHVYARVADKLLSVGFIPLIKEMQDEATRIVNEEALGPWATLAMNDLKHGKPHTDENLRHEFTIGYDDISTVLFLLRYPKRFSPIGNDIIRDATLKDFLQMENRTKMLQLRPSFAYRYLIPYVRDAVYSMYDWETICDEIERLTPQDLLVSSGVAVDAPSTLGDKIKVLLNDGNLDYQLPIMGSYTLDRRAVEPIVDTESVIQAVPKSYKAARIIAMESVKKNAFGKAVESLFRTQDERSDAPIHLDRQDLNQTYAKEGSETGRLATLDASHASDLISRSLYIDVFPPRYTHLVDWAMPHICEVQGRKHPLQMASTSGHTLTFRHETIVYKAIGLAALRIYEGLVGAELPHQDRLVWAYGDDVIIPSEIYDVAVYCYQRLGLIINDDKSYASGSFRESCGKDYFRGRDVTSLYYPRFPVVGSVAKDKISLGSAVYKDEYRGKLENSLTMLIDLQKKLLPFSYDASRLVLSIIKSAYPSVTTSVVGTVCNDLWDYVDSGKPRVPAAYGIEHVGKYYSHTQANYRFKRTGDARDTLTGSNQKLFDRACDLDRQHVYPSVSHRGRGKFSPYDEAVYEYWKYQNFLQFGPRYSSPLDRLLGVSSPQMSLSEFFGKTELVLVTK